MLISTPWQTRPWLGVGLDRANPLTAGLTYCYALNEGAGRTLVNLGSAGPANDGVFQTSAGKTPYWTSGPQGHQLHSGNYWVDCGSIANLGTLRQWTCLALGEMVAGQLWVFGSMDVSDYRFGVDVRASAYYTWVGSGTLAYGLQPPGTLVGYHSVVGVYDGQQPVQTDRLRMYVDGQPRSGSYANSNVPASYTPSASNRLWIGQGSFGSAGNGRYDLCAFWTRALSPDEIAAIAANPWQLFEPRRLLATGAPAALTADAALGLTLGLASSRSVTFKPTAALGLKLGPPASRAVVVKPKTALGLKLGTTSLRAADVKPKTALGLKLGLAAHVGGPQTAIVALGITFGLAASTTFTPDPPERTAAMGLKLGLFSRAIVRYRRALHPDPRLATSRRALRVPSSEQAQWSFVTTTAAANPNPGDGGGPVAPVGDSFTLMGLI